MLNLLKWMKILIQFTPYHAILYYDRSSKAGQLLIYYFCGKQKYERESRFKAKVNILFYAEK
jgi:hypothetical protein